MKIQSYEDLEVWKKSMDLVEKIYLMTKTFPADERFGLVTQMQRAAVSIPSNIAEGYRRRGRGDYLKFLGYSYGSGAELETQLEISYRLKYCMEGRYQETKALLTEVMKMFNVMMWKLESTRSSATPYTPRPTP
jgi:four helix bundle protein